MTKFLSNLLGNLCGTMNDSYPYLNRNKTLSQNKRGIQKNDSPPISNKSSPRRLDNNQTKFNNSPTKKKGRAQLEVIKTNENKTTNTQEKTNYESTPQIKKPDIPLRHPLHKRNSITRNKLEEMLPRRYDTYQEIFHDEYPINVISQALTPITKAQTTPEIRLPTRAGKTKQNVNNENRDEQPRRARYVAQPRQTNNKNQSASPATLPRADGTQNVNVENRDEQPQTTRYERFVRNARYRNRLDEQGSQHNENKTTKACDKYDESAMRNAISKVQSYYNKTVKTDKLDTTTPKQIDMTQIQNNKEKINNTQSNQESLKTPEPQLRKGGSTQSFNKRQYRSSISEFLESTYSKTSSTRTPDVGILSIQTQNNGRKFCSNPQNNYGEAIKQRHTLDNNQCMVGMEPDILEY